MGLMNLTQLAPMTSDETAALLFICGDQYLFRYRTKDNGTAYKFVSAASVRAAFAEETIDTNWLPSNVRRWGIGNHGEWIVITFPPQIHRLSFVDENDERKTMTLELPMPALAFFGYGQRYYLWAFKDAELKGDTNLYAAPLPNVDANGAICFGSNLVPKVSAKTITEAWHILLASPFTNHSVNGKSCKYPDDVRKQLIRLAERRRRHYPLDDLVSLNRTANMVIDGMLRVKGIE
jgi:PRTRC genetic system protein B